MRTNVSIVQDMYATFAMKDELTARGLLHLDIEWIQCAGFPGGGHLYGVDEVIEKVFAGLHSEWNDWRVEIDEYLDAGEKDENVVVLGHYAGTHAVTGRPMTAVFAHVYDLDKGRITRFRQYTDTHQLVRAGQG